MTKQTAIVRWALYTAPGRSQIYEYFHVIPKERERFRLGPAEILREKDQKLLCWLCHGGCAGWGGCGISGVCGVRGPLIQQVRALIITLLCVFAHKNNFWSTPLNELAGQ